MVAPVRVAVVTGASRGLGRVVAGFLVASGYRVIVVARSKEALIATARSIDVADRVTAMAADVGRAEHRQRLVRLVERIGRLDLLINNASELGPSPLVPLAELPVSELDRVLQVNLVGPMALTQALLPLLRESRGLVVNISSDAAVGAYPRWGAYGSSKAALDLLTRTWAAELKHDFVSVVSVDPGDMRTEMHQAAFRGEDISDRPLPEVTLPFWAWLLGQEPARVSGARFQAQADKWEIPA